MIATNRRQFMQYFRVEVLPLVRQQFEDDGRVDVPARREAWNNEVDTLLRAGQLPRRAAEWAPPW